MSAKKAKKPVFAGVERPDLWQAGLNTTLAELSEAADDLPQDGRTDPPYHLRSHVKSLVRTHLGLGDLAFVGKVLDVFPKQGKTFKLGADAEDAIVDTLARAYIDGKQAWALETCVDLGLPAHRKLIATKAREILHEAADKHIRSKPTRSLGPARYRASPPPGANL